MPAAELPDGVDERAVFLVGAGISRALSDAMPTVAELREPLRAFTDTLYRDIALPAIDDVETLLSYLATPQPFLSKIENLENEALFGRVAAWLADELFRRQNRCLSEGSIPKWFEELLAFWHRHHSTVITLNYDTLVEAGVDTLRLDTEGRVARYQNIYPVDIAPLASRGGYAVLGHDDVASFHLIKLHGSLNWFYSGAQSFFGERIYDVGQVSQWNHAAPPSRDAIDRPAAGLVPLVVPPTHAKNSYFENDLVRALWARARQALAAAPCVYLLGYSLPDADTQMLGLLASTCRAKPVVVVNLDPEVGYRATRALPGARVDASSFVGPASGDIRMFSTTAQ